MPLGAPPKGSGASGSLHRCGNDAFVLSAQQPTAISTVFRRVMGGRVVYGPSLAVIIISFYTVEVAQHALQDEVMR